MINDFGKEGSPRKQGGFLKRNPIGVWGSCVLVGGLVLAPIAHRGPSLTAGAAELQATPACETKGNSKIVLVKMDDENRLMATIRINDRVEENFQIDTGADDLIFSHDAGVRLGLHLTDENYSETSETASDVVRIAPFVVDSLEIGPIRLTNVPSFVQENAGENLLGMSVLQKLKFNFQDGCFRLEQ